MSDPANREDQLIGREAELGSLRAELAAAMQKSGRLILLSGDPGIGKTTLAAAHAAEAEARGAVVVWGRCHEATGAPPYWPWIQILDGLDKAGAESADPHAGELRALLPEVHAQSSISEESRSGHARFEFFARVARSLARFAQKRGIVIVIDDLHWADAASRRLLQFLAGELSTDSILLVATLRDDEPATQGLIEDLARHARCIPVGPLDRGALERLLAERLPETRPRGSTEASPGANPNNWVEEVWERSHGNPFFALELAQLMLSNAPGKGSRFNLPAGVKTVLEKRLAPLSEQVHELLQVAAVIGRSFDLSLLARTLEREPDELYEALEPALSLGLLNASSGVVPRFAFAHALIRETLYESLDARKASALHGRVGKALESPGGTGPDLFPALAHHFYEAARTSGPEKAVHYNLEAGSRALSQLAYEEAVLHFERAIAILEPGGEAEPLIHAQIRLADSLLGTGERARAESIAHQAMTRARDEDAPALLARSVLCWSGAREEIGLVDPDTNAALEAAIALLGEDEDPGLRARLFSRLAAGLHLVPGSESRQRSLGERAAELAREAADPATTAFVQLRRLATLLGPDDREERLRAIDSMMETARGQPINELSALAFRVDALAEAADRMGLDQALAIFDQMAASVRHPFFRWGASCFRAAMALVEGRYEEAEASMVQALQAGAQVQEQTAGLQFAQQMLMLRGWQNRLEEVIPLVEGGVEATRVIPAWRCALADLYEMQGRRDEARREFEAVAADDFSSLPRSATWLPSLVLLAGVCVRLGDDARAATLYRLLSPYAGRIAVTTPLIVMVSPIDTRLGILAGFLGHYDEAETHFAAALELAERMRALTWQGDARFYFAEMLQRRGRSEDAPRVERLLAEAESIARTVGMDLLVEWIDALRQSAQEPQAVAPSAKSNASASFRCEGEVYTLEFEGRTTRLRSIAGLGHLRRLLETPGSELHALDLVAEAEGRARAPSPGDAGESLDSHARADYEARLRDLRDELEEAERINDRGRAEQLAEEREFVMAELSHGFGLGGRARRERSGVERARLSVTRAIKYAIRKIAEHDGALAQILERDVRTGSYCSYAPTDRDRIEWSL